VENLKFLEVCRMNLFNLFVALEVVGISAVGLATLSGKPAALVSSLRYLLAAITGAMSYLFGLALLFAGFGTLDLTLLAERIEPGTTVKFAMVLMTLGVLLLSSGLNAAYFLPIVCRAWFWNRTGSCRRDAGRARWRRSFCYCSWCWRRFCDRR
jgi:formate hydrogenlyase subunit 3/multisubunit Na+/H+ antiporter MnhD subunit